MRRSVSQETCLMKYVDASGQGLSTQMGQVISAGNPETLFVQSRWLMVCFFPLIRSPALKTAVEPAHFLHPQDLRVSRYKLDRKKEDSMNLKKRLTAALLSAALAPCLWWPAAAPPTREPQLPLPSAEPRITRSHPQTMLLDRFGWCPYSSPWSGGCLFLPQAPGCMGTADLRG